MYRPGELRRFYTGAGHTKTIRCSVMVQGIPITGSEDSSVIAWSMQDSPVTDSEPRVQEKIKTKEQRYFKPY